MDFDSLRWISNVREFRITLPDFPGLLWSYYDSLDLSGQYKPKRKSLVHIKRPGETDNSAVMTLFSTGAYCLNQARPYSLFALFPP